MAMVNVHRGLWTSRYLRSNGGWPVTRAHMPGKAFVTPSAAGAQPSRLAGEGGGPPAEPVGPGIKMKYPLIKYK